MSWADVVAGLAASKCAAATSPPARRRRSTAGTFASGCTPNAVLQWLRASPGKTFGLAHIAAAVDRPKATVSWALHQLREHGLVDRRLFEPARAIWWAQQHGDEERTP